MSIKITCSSCNATYEVKDELAGKRAKCAKCGNIIEIPKISVEENTFSNENEDNIITDDILPNEDEIQENINDNINDNISTEDNNIEIKKDENIQINNNQDLNNNQNIPTQNNINYGAIKDESVMNHNPLINETSPKKHSFIKFLKISFILTLFLLSIFFLSIYISSLFSYKETDFNIPEGALNSKHFDKKYDSEQNGFLDLVKVVDNIKKDRNLIMYFEEKYLCNFSENKQEKESNCKNAETYKFDNFKETDEEKIKQYVKENEKKHLKEITNIIEKNQQELKEVIKKDYIYSENGIKNPPFPLTDIIRIYRSSVFVANEYINYGIQEKGIQILLNNQEIINGLMEKSDLDLGENFILIKCADYNLNGIEYIIKNHEIKTTEKQKLKQILENNLSYNLIDNGIKREYDENIGTIIKENETNKFKNKVLFFFFYSEKETSIFFKNLEVEIIKNKGKLDSLKKLNLNINNYIGRQIYNSNFSDLYEKYYKKETDLIEKQKSISEKIK